jgi:hypothetical protein
MCTTIWFWGAFTRLPTSTTTTSPNSLQRLRCYDDDMADPSSSSTAAAGYLSLSLLLIYLFFFLSVLQYACLDVLQSSFKYACLECVTFKLPICVYIIIMSNNFWINIMRKLSKFLTQNTQYYLFVIFSFSFCCSPKHAMRLKLKRVTPEKCDHNQQEASRWLWSGSCNKYLILHQALLVCCTCMLPLFRIC